MDQRQTSIENMIHIEHLDFEYPGVRALDDISLQVQTGDITALVGPNGAGKTTLLRCIAALETPISGKILVNGIDVLHEPRQVHRQIGYLADFYGLYSNLTVEQSLRYAALSHSTQPAQLQAVVQFAAQRLNLENRLGDKVGTLSRGLSQRLAIAQAIVHEPTLLLLDEPASGLDPEARRSLSELFVTLQQQGITLLVSSHILAELEEYCTSMVILSNGVIVEHHSMSESMKTEVLIHIQTSTTVNSWEILTHMPGVELLQSDINSCLIRCDRDKQKMQSILATLIRADIPVYTFSEEKMNMQDAYLSKVRHLSPGVDS